MTGEENLTLRYELASNRRAHYAYCRTRFETGAAWTLSTAKDVVAAKVALERNVAFCRRAEREELDEMLQLRKLLTRPLHLLPPARP